jgi:hypothetical protein
MIRRTYDVECIGQKRNAYKILTEEFNREQLTVKASDTIKTRHEETGREFVDWINLAQDKGSWTASVV